MPARQLLGWAELRFHHGIVRRLYTGDLHLRRPRAATLTLLPRPERLSGERHTGKDEVRQLGRYRTALVSGWAKDADFARLFGADATFDLSDHCDFDELFEVVERSGADQVYTVHGYTEDFARHLRRKGIKAWALEKPEQLQLALSPLTSMPSRPSA